MDIDATQVASHAENGDRAEQPGPRRMRGVAFGAAVIAGTVMGVGVSACGSGQTVKYGHPPSSVTIAEPPTTTAESTATPAHPDFNAGQGFPVHATLNTGSATLNAVGPSIPGWFATEANAGKVPATELAPSTFDVTLSATQGSIPLAADQFTVITYQGKILRPKVTLAGGGALPTKVPAGRSVKLALATSLPEGDGAIRWAPNRQRILVSWAWSLEIT